MPNPLVTTAAARYNPKLRFWDHLACEHNAQVKLIIGGLARNANTMPFQTRGIWTLGDLEQAVRSDRIHAVDATHSFAPMNRVTTNGLEPVHGSQFELEVLPCDGKNALGRSSF